MPSDVIIAAGGVPWRLGRDGELRLAVVHRARYDDWSFPKGKLRPTEAPLLGALREVREETGLDVVPARRLSRVSYESAEGPKHVDYWCMRATGSFVANDETDALDWLTPQRALDRLSYDDDRGLVDQLLAEPLEPVTVLLVRHALAGDSDSWTGPDDVRPLDEPGRRQAEALVPALSAFRPGRILTAEPLRCRQTVQPVAESLGLPVAVAEEFGENAYAEARDATRASLRALLEAPSVSVVCSQGGVIPALVTDVLTAGARVSGVSPTRDDSDPPARKGSVWAFTVHDGRVATADYYGSFRA